MSKWPTYDVRKTPRPRPLPGLTLAETEAVRDAAGRTWDAVAADLLSAEEWNSRLGRSPVTLAIRCETVIDADRLVALGGLDRALHAKLTAIPYPVLARFVRPLVRGD